MTDDDVKRAVERLKDSSGIHVSGRMSRPTFKVVDLNEPLAALIADLLQGRYCRACGEADGHAPDCALVALVRAINGEGER